MASIAKRKYRRGGKVVESDTWHVLYSDQHGKQRRVAAFTEKRASEALARRLDELVACRATGTAPGAELAVFIDQLPDRVLKHLRNANLLDAAQVAGAKPLADHLADWTEHLRQKGDSEKHVEQRTGRVQRLLEAVGAVWWQELDPDAVEHALALWRDSGRLSVATSNAYRSAVKQFCRWLHRTGRAPSNALTHLSRQNPAGHRKRKRRALTPAECSRLLQAARASDKVVQGVPGPERALIYRTALETGARLNELATLERRHLDLDAQPPMLTIEAAHSKGKHTDTLPLRPGLAEALRAHCIDKLPAAPVFSFGDWPRGADMLKVDLEAAGIPYEDSSGRVADFHALRMTFITNLARSGVHPRVAQELARHSDIKLTLETYTHVALDTKTEAVAALPDLDTGEADAATGGAT